jgi:2-polyprenyl-3-methyl-5-hydroxy-6-metoxy-1,4-benzoquinol methylase
MWNAAMAANLEKVEAALRSTPAGGSLIDLGCDDGTNTGRFAAAARAATVHGVEIVHERAELARARGFEVREANLNKRLPYSNGTFNVVASNQVIEHVFDTDRLLAKLGGFFPLAELLSSRQRVWRAGTTSARSGSAGSRSL